jgi:hypothetical protein
MAEFVVDAKGLLGVCNYDKRFHGNILSKTNGLPVDILFLSTAFNGFSAIGAKTILLNYCFFKYMRTPSGLNALFLSFCLCCFHIVMMLTKILQHMEIACLVISLCRHYTWLSVCCCLSVSAFHQFFFFRGFNPKTDDDISEIQPRSPVLLHLIFSFLFPLAVVGLNAGLLFVFLSEIPYNSDSCLINHELSYILTFLAPLIITVIMTFSLNCATIKVIFSSEEILNLKRKWVEFFLVFKFLIVIGVLIVFQVTEWFVKSENFTFVVDLLVSLQGCTILLVFLCTTHICDLCRVAGENLSLSGSIPSLETEKQVTSADGQ